MYRYNRSPHYRNLFNNFMPMKFMIETALTV